MSPLVSAPRTSPARHSLLQLPLWLALSLAVAPAVLLGGLVIRNLALVTRETAAISDVTAIKHAAQRFAADLRTSQVVLRDYTRTLDPALRQRLARLRTTLQADGEQLLQVGAGDSGRDAAWRRMLERRTRMLDSVLAVPPPELAAWWAARTPTGVVDTMLTVVDRAVLGARRTADARQATLAAQVRSARQQALALVAIGIAVAITGTVLVVRAVRGERALRTRLALEQARLERTFEDAPTGMLIADAAGRFTRVNAALCEMLGYAPTELLGRTYPEITHPEDLAGDAELQARLEAGAIPRFEYEKRYLAKDGSVVPVTLHVSTVRRPDGSLDHYLAMIVDRRPQEAARLDADRRKAELRSILDGAEDMVIRYDAEERVTYANAAACRIIEKPMAALIGISLEEGALSTDDAARWRAALRRVRETGRPEGWEFEHAPPGGVRRWISVRLTPVRGLAGEITGVVEFSRDLPAQRTAELELRRQEAQFLTLVETTEDAIVRYDADLVLRYMNPAAVRSTGIPAGELLGKHVTELPLGEELAPRWVAAVRAARDAGTRQHVEYRFPDGHGRVHHYDARLTPERDLEGQVVGVLAVSRDITALREAANRLVMREAELRSIVNTSEDLIYRYDPAGRIRFINPSVVRASGRSLAEVEGMTIPEALGETPLSRLLTGALTRVLTTGVAETVEYSLVRSQDGQEHFYTSRFTPERTPAGQIAGVVVLATDITARHRIESERERLLEELTRAQAAVKTLKGLLPTCAWCHRIKDDDGHWEQMEDYIRHRTEAEFSHGLCPDCATRMMTEE